MHFKLSIENVYKSFDPPEAANRRYVLRGISVQVATGEFVSLLGHTGCGKSTLLNLIAGYIRPDKGQILIDGKRIEGPGADRGVVFQEYALFPWYTVLENVALCRLLPAGRGGSELDQSENLTENLGLACAHLRAWAIARALKHRAVRCHSSG